MIAFGASIQGMHSIVRSALARAGNVFLLTVFPLGLIYTAITIVVYHGNRHPVFPLWYLGFSYGVVGVIVLTQIWTSALSFRPLGRKAWLGGLNVLPYCLGFFIPLAILSLLASLAHDVKQTILEAISDPLAPMRFCLLFSVVSWAPFFLGSLVATLGTGWLGHPSSAKPDNIHPHP